MARPSTWGVASDEPPAKNVAPRTVPTEHRSSKQYRTHENAGQSGLFPSKTRVRVDFFLPEQRLGAYRALVLKHVEPVELDAICAHLQSQHAYGTYRYREMIEPSPDHRAAAAMIGWTRKADGAPHVEGAL